MFQLFLKKGLGFFALILGQWKSISLIFGLIASLYLYHKLKVSKLIKINNKALEQISLLKAENVIIKQSNSSYLIAQSELKKANRNCVFNNLANEQTTKQALIDLENSNNEINQKYKSLADSQVSSICGNTIIDVELW